MQKKQINKNLPPRISMFDKHGQANLSKVNKNKVNLPQFRINQHKGS
ncbi:MAG: hypothetical protein Q8Q30_00445 [Candidatus Woesebacteria bacterium]|nr:hypothetical protein [Candidatus Woesebacteria bacterium]